MVRDQRIHFIYSMNTKKPQVISVYENKFKKRSHIALFKINKDMNRRQAVSPKFTAPSYSGSLLGNYQRSLEV